MIKDHRAGERRDRYLGVISGSNRKERAIKERELLAQATSGFICEELMLLAQTTVEARPVAMNLCVKVNYLASAFLI